MFKKLALLFVLLLTIYMVIPDTELSSGALDWLAEKPVHVEEQNNLFPALVGLTSDSTEDFVKEGQRLIQSANTQLALFLESDTHLENGAQPEFDPHWTKPALTVTEGVNILCEPRTDDCRENWRSQQDTISAVLKENKILLARYTALYNYKDYHTTLAVDVRSPQPDFTTLMSLNRLHGADIAIRFLSGEPDHAIATLNQDMKFLRRFLANADTLMAKMITLAMLKHDLYIYASLMDVAGTQSYLFDDISWLSETEQSFAGPIKYEFRMNNNLIEEIKTSPELITGDLGVPAWLPFPLFRKNHSINMLHQSFSGILDHSRMNTATFVNFLGTQPQTDDGMRPGWMDYMYNPIGSILFSVSLPDFNKYIIRMHDMNGLISMINLKRVIKQENIKSANMENYIVSRRDYAEPYYGKPFDWNPAEQTLSFQSVDYAFTRYSLIVSFEDQKERDTEIH